jgi:succinate dehydrogenase hydrophobic anchor subunit
MSHQKITVIERALAVLSIPFFVCLIIHMLIGAGHFLALVRGWPWWTILCSAGLGWHATRELQVIFEDYIKNLCVRKRLIVSAYAGYFLSISVIVWQVLIL